jgi:hypothetical protein
VSHRGSSSSANVLASPRQKGVGAVVMDWLEHDAAAYVGGLEEFGASARESGRGEL